MGSSTGSAALNGRSGVDDGFIEDFLLTACIYFHRRAALPRSLLSTQVWKSAYGGWAGSTSPQPGQEVRAGGWRSTDVIII